MLDAYTMPDEETFIDFLQTGKLGALHPGLSEQQIYDLLGKPDETDFIVSLHESPNQSEKALVMTMKYGNLQLLCAGGEISFITVDYQYEDYGLPTGLGISWFDAAKKMKLNSFRQFLRDREISYKRVVLPDFWSNIILVVNGKTEVLFGTHDAESIDGFSFAVDGIGRPVMDDV